MKAPIHSTLTIGLDASLKRIAWAYGCAKKGSDEERQLGELLVAKVQAEAAAGTQVAEIGGAA